MANRKFLVVKSGTFIAVWFISLFGPNPAVHAQATPQKQIPLVDVAKLIDKLVDVGDQDYGYSASMTGSVFTPIDSAGTMTMGMLFQAPPVQSSTVRELVKQGARAVPHLVEHLGDKRKTKITVSQGPGMFTVCDDDEPGPAKGLRSHTITVGDLCYVALGQILNQYYAAVMYIPSGNIFIQSPTRSAKMRKELVAEWTGMTAEKHKKMLLTQLASPAWLDHRVGAAKRLAYYYPDDLEPAATKIISEPTYDSAVAWKFTEESLYKAKDANAARQLLDSFVKKHGEVYRGGVGRCLAEEPDEGQEKKRSSLLAQLFTKDELRLSTVLEHNELGSLIGEGLMRARESTRLANPPKTRTLPGPARSGSLGVDLTRKSGNSVINARLSLPRTKTIASSTSSIAEAGRVCTWPSNAIMSIGSSNGSPRAKTSMGKASRATRRFTLP
jgi:hypothetical protein